MYITQKQLFGSLESRQFFKFYCMHLTNKFVKYKVNCLKLKLGSTMTIKTQIFLVKQKHEYVLSFHFKMKSNRIQVLLNTT